MSLPVTMGHEIPGREIAGIVGIARGSVVKARFFVRDIFASIRNLIGGEVNEYSELLEESREEAFRRMRCGDLTAYGQLYDSADAAEGMASVMEKRAPQWTGR